MIYVLFKNLIYFYFFYRISYKKLFVIIYLLCLFNVSINLITGGAGFIGSHLIDKLLESGEKVICLDNFFTGGKEIIGLVTHLS